MVSVPGKTFYRIRVQIYCPCSLIVCIIKLAIVTCFELDRSEEFIIALKVNAFGSTSEIRGTIHQNTITLSKSHYCHKDSKDQGKKFSHDT